MSTSGLSDRCGDGWRLDRAGLTGSFAWWRALRWRVVPRLTVLGAERVLLLRGVWGVTVEGGISSSGC